MAYMNLEKKEVIGSDGNKYQRQPVLCFCRVMGYLAPTINFNKGKRSEFMSRRRFTEDKALKHDNSKFIERYSAIQSI